MKLGLLILFACASLSYAVYQPLPADTPESVNRNFKDIDFEMKRIDLTLGGSIIGDLIITGSINVSTRTVNSPVTIGDGDHYVSGDASGGSFTITLPALSGIAGRVYTIKRISSGGGLLTIDGNGAETIDGALTAVINKQFDSISLIAGDSEWHIF